MMVMAEARKVARLFAECAKKDKDEAENELFPHCLETLTYLVASQINVKTVKEQYLEHDQMRQTKAQIDEAISQYLGQPPRVRR